MDQKTTLILAIILGVILLAWLITYFLRRTSQGMLDLKAALMLFVLPKDSDITVEKARSLYNKLTDKKNKQDKLSLASVTDIEVPHKDRHITCRSYDNQPDSTKPVIVYIHGGGWCIGSIATHERTCKKIALATGYNVLSVEYSLAPEHPYPTALEECMSVVEYVHSNTDKFNTKADSIIIMGDSAGANLAIATTMALIDKGRELVDKLVAIYPITDASKTDTPSYNYFEKGFFLTKKMMRRFIDHYAPEESDRTNPLVSPRFYNHLEKLPPVHLITAQFDPLRDEGEAFAKQLKEAGNDCTSKRYDGMIHGFFANPMFGAKGDGAVDDVASYLHSTRSS